MAAAHVVQDLEFEVDFESEAQALDLQDRLSAFARGPALRILAEAFDQAGGSHERWQLERLELDLGTVEPGEFEQQWADRLRERLRQVLAELTAHGPDPGQTSHAAPAVRRSTAREGDLAALLHYLYLGVLPWQAAGADPAELAQRVWQHDRAALVSRLRAWPDPPAAARRMAGQFPATWCAQVAQEVLGEVAPGVEAAGPEPVTAAAVEGQLLRALRANAPVAVAPKAAQAVTAGRLPMPPELRAARRRLRALLVDDAPELPDDDLGELMQLWRRLHDEDAEGLREELESVLRRARVRRRMAQLWPESLLRQLPRLWLGEAEGQRALAALQAGNPHAGAAARRLRWEALLRLMWVGDAVQPIDALALDHALRGRSEAPLAAALRVGPGRAQASVPLRRLLGSPHGPGDVEETEDRGLGVPPLEPRQPSLGWEALLSDIADAAAGRRALREAVSTARRRQRLASTATAAALARALALWWPAQEAEALAAMAFAPLPPPWQRVGEAALRSEQLVAECLRALDENADADWTAQGLARHWWQVLAVLLARSPGELLRALAEASTDDAQSDRCGAWLRWLPAPGAAPASSVDVVDAGSSAADLAAALHEGDAAALQSAWTALIATGEAAARVSLRRLGDTAPGRDGLARHLGGPQWEQLLAVFLAPGPARALVRAQQEMLGALQESDAAEAEVWVRGWVLPVLLWRPAATAGDVATHLLDQGARRAGMTAAALVRCLPPGDDSLFRGRAAERAAVDLNRARAEAADAGAPQRRRADAEAAATVISALRGNGLAADPGSGVRALLMALVERESAVARALIDRELESGPSARALADALAPQELLRLVAWLRPADAAGLLEAWPRLHALAAGARASAWPQVARTVLRELFEEDRPLRPESLVQRAGRAVPGTPDAPPAPWTSASHDGPLFVGNAGVVLLAPYLPRLFGLLGLADDKAFADAAAAERAVAAMQYAVTGVAGAPETQLPLNKLMCGLALHAPISRDVELERADCEAVDGMLRAVIGHWKALGQTSVAGLRQTFLQREGRLEHKEEAWHLQVPSQTFDMLIDRLPWGFSTIRYPWMREVLHVQWR